MTPRRRKKENKDLPPGLSPNGKYFKFTHPVTKVVTSINLPREQAIAKVQIVLDILAKQQRQRNEDPLLRKMLGIQSSAGKTFREIMLIHKDARMAERPNPNTQKTLRAVFSVIERAPFIDRPIRTIAVLEVNEWLEGVNKHHYRRIRTELIQIWALAIRKGWQDHRDGNPAEFTQKKSAPPSQRARLPEDHMYRIAAAGTSHLRLAIYLILQTTCRPCDVVWMRRADFVGNSIKCKIRKSERDLDPTTAKYREFILPEDAAGEIRRMSQDGVASPFIVHKRTGITKKLARGHEHWSQCTVDLLSREFSAIRDRLGLWDHVESKRQRPSLYECRALAGHMMIQQDCSDEDVQERMAHSDPATTQIYTARHEEFTPEYVPVNAGLKVKF